MDVIAICRSRKKMRAKTASTLDRYLYRIGDRTWRGRASMECLKRISQDLKKRASRNMAVALYRDGAKELHQRPLFIVGARGMFAADGRCAISTRTRQQAALKPAGEVGLLGMVETAALFHDVGKASNLFQNKLRTVLKNGKPLADAVRHELVSAMVLAELIPISSSDASSVAARLAEISADPSMIENAWVTAADLCFKAFKADTPDHEIFTRSGGQTSAALGDPASCRSQLILLVLSHHRLPSGFHKNGTLTCATHVDSSKHIVRLDLDVAPGTPFWREAWFSERLKTSSDRILESKYFSSKSLDVWARTALMSADHIGSYQKSISNEVGHLANLKGEPALPADSLFKHVQRVTRATRALTIGPLRQSWRCPSISEELVPAAISKPQISGSRFDWQVHAAHAAAELSANGSGGFFATLIAGTGAGKTRGAATVMAAAALHDHDEERRGLRYNLALPLRTLASQSGQEYVQDLGFSPADVATLVGGHKVNWSDQETRLEVTSEATGSQDRFQDETLIEEVDTSQLSLELSSLNSNEDRMLPLYLQRVVEASSDRGLSRFLTTPILSATIDHFMPVAAPLRSFHLAATHRVMTSDLVIDELDLLSEEDISAVKRLVRVAACAGRRVILMSATLPAAIAQDFYAVYADGYAQYAALKGCTPKIKYLCAGDARNALASSATSSSFADAFNKCKTTLSNATSESPITHLAEILPRAKDWPHQVSLIKGKAKELHLRHGIDMDGVKTSVGLIRMTRIKHLQALAMEMAMADDGCHYVILHSAMPRLQRENIELGLKSALTRKGGDPNHGLRSFLQTYGIIPQEASDIRVIVLASPVIETGNDVDFDWLITDPSSTRSIIQASGRVNRHRRALITTPNIAILGDYAVYRQARSGSKDQLMEYPGVETPPSSGTDVRRLRIADSHAIERLLDQNGPFPVNADISNLEYGLPQYEAELQSRFATVCRDDFSNSLFWWVRDVALRHRFRRPTTLEVEAFPISGDEEIWKFFSGRGRKRTLEAIKVETLSQTLFPGRVLFEERLPDLMRMAKGEQEGKPVLCSPLPLAIRGEEEISDAFFLDPYLGRISKEGDIPAITFATLQKAG